MTMTNAEWMIQQGYKFDDLNVLYTKDVGVYAISIKKNGAYTCLGTIKKIGAIYAFMEWLDQEHIEPILDDAERAYLSAVIKPFRDRVKYIKKVFVDHLYGDADYYIFIRFNSGSEDMYFPVFHDPDMYKGMKFGKTYTPEELGL